MSSRLPPLNSLRFFDAAARSLSFTRAAEELFVTQAAVSQQIRLLEEWLGAKLFIRRGRSLLLTPAAQEYAVAVRGILAEIEQSTRRIQSPANSRELVVSVLPSFAAAWLVPRLNGFITAHPDISLRIAPDSTLRDFASGDFDLGIRYGSGNYPGLVADKLFGEDIFPVCSPDLVRGKNGLKHYCDLKRFTLLHDDRHGDWRVWLLAAGIDGVDVNKGPVFTDSAMTIQAAMEGHGVALARHVLARDHLNAGRLVKPFDLSLPAEYAYYLVFPQWAENSPAIRAFRKWLVGEAARSELGSAVAGAH